MLLNGVEFFALSKSPIDSSWDQVLQQRILHVEQRHLNKDTKPNRSLKRDVASHFLPVFNSISSDPVGSFLIPLRAEGIVEKI